ncbi:MAG: Bax inhibitor-1/YccA family protein [Caulobacterales bacterium]|nr:Bax inhibitor-1/YccA family protein [Caulobacterales bacterium]
MNDYNTAYGRPGAYGGTMDMSVDAGLRAFMLGVYNKMALGLVLSAVLAYVVGTVAPVTMAVLTPPMIYIVQWGPIALLFGSMFFMRNPSPTGSAVLYWSVVTLIGAGLGVWVFLATNGVAGNTLGGQTLNVTFTNIARAFMITAAAFAGLSLFGYTTKRDLSGLHSFAIMAIWGLLLVGISNFFFQSAALEIGIQVIGLLLFSVLVATQTQTLKSSYYAYAGDARSMAVMTNFGALNLYIAFVQIFQFLLMLLSGRE